MTGTVYTVGHSTHTESVFLDLLHRHQITMVADVRSQPYSRFNPQFNRENLDLALKRAGIAYVFLGRELGARTKDPSCYVEGKVDYGHLASTELFRNGLARIEELMETQQVALMCAEKDPLTCHRAILVARHLREDGTDIQHILDTGDLESHDATVMRLLGELKMPSHDLFWSDEDLVAEAYRRRGADIAHELRPDTPLLASER